jgi:hypothetical protein
VVVAGKNKKPISVNDAVKRIGRIILQFIPAPGLVMYGRVLTGWVAERMEEFGKSGYVSFEWEVCPGVSARVSINLSLPDGGPRVNVAWPSEARSVTEAQACVALFQRVVDFAAIVQAFLDAEIAGREIEFTEDEGCQRGRGT